MQTSSSCISAAILSTDIETGTLQQMARALHDAGYSDVKTLPHLPDLRRSDDDDDFHLPEELSDVRFVIIDESVGGRSAFELEAILKASAESAVLQTGVLLGASPHIDSSMLAAWSAGFDLCLVRERLDMGELSNLSRQILVHIKAE